MVFHFCIATKPVTVHLVLALAECQSVLPRESLGDSCRFAEVVVALYLLLAVVHPVVYDMQVWMRLVLVPVDDVLSIHNPHALHVLLCYLHHEFI